jgi:hypothetical protein
LIALPNAIVLFGAVTFMGVEGAAVIALLRSMLYFVGRAIATGMTTLPTFEVCMQILFVFAAAVMAIMPVNQLYRSIGMFLILACSISLAAVNRPAVVDELWVSLTSFIRKPRPC